jgi:hypothetical protein
VPDSGIESYLGVKAIAYGLDVVGYVGVGWYWEKISSRSTESDDAVLRDLSVAHRWYVRG